MRVAATVSALVALVAVVAGVVAGLPLVTFAGFVLSIVNAVVVRPRLRAARKSTRHVDD